MTDNQSHKAQTDTGKLQPHPASAPPSETCDEEEALATRPGKRIPHRLGRRQNHTYVLSGSAISEAGRAVVAFIIGVPLGPISLPGQRFVSTYWREGFDTVPWPTSPLELIRLPSALGFRSLEQSILLAMAGPVAQTTLISFSLDANLRPALHNHLIPDHARTLAECREAMAAFADDLSLAWSQGTLKFASDSWAVAYLGLAEERVRNLLKFSDVRAAIYAVSGALEESVSRETPGLDAAQTFQLIMDSLCDERSPDGGQYLWPYGWDAEQDGYGDRE
jgi:hypothetical protein